MTDPSYTSGYQGQGQDYSTSSGGRYSSGNQYPQSGQTTGYSSTYGSGGTDYGREGRSSGSNKHSEKERSVQFHFLSVSKGIHNFFFIPRPVFPLDMANRANMNMSARKNRGDGTSLHTVRI
jgi:hypothetical protein